MGMYRVFCTTRKQVSLVVVDVSKQALGDKNNNDGNNYNAHFLLLFFSKNLSTRKWTHGFKKTKCPQHCCWDITGKYVDVQDAYVDHRRQGNPERMSPE
jgi:hypothetical protein